MKTPEELLREFAHDPGGLADYAFGLQEELRAREQQLADKQRELLRQGEQLAEAQAIIAELKQQLFGSQSEKLTPEQEEQLNKLHEELKDQADQPAPLSDEVLDEALQEERREQRQRSKEGRKKKRRHVPPVQLEKQSQTLEPEDKFCPHTGKARPRIGQETTTEYDFVPAKLIIREIIRPKYGECGRDCCAGVTIAPLPPRLMPQSKLGLGLAVFILLSRFDDHVAYYTLERNFLERHGVVIPRQQMVQWVEKIAHLLLGIYWLILEEMKLLGYLQIDETPVKVLDPEIKGKAGRGYLWFYSVPGGDVFLEFCQGRGREGPRERLKEFRGTIQTDAYEVYESLRREAPGRLKRIGCLGHARRRFYKALQV